MSKQEIDPRDIRKGDLIRFEYANVPGQANEYIAAGNEIPTHQPGTHYLLDRPTPPVDLPTEPTLGWLTSTVNAHVLHIWRPRRLRGGPGVEPGQSIGFRALVPEVTAFTPATAVPTEALDELRTQHRVNVTLESRYDSVTRFLAAVDEANE